MKKQLSKYFLLYGSILLILKLYLTGLFPAALFMDWKTYSQSLLLVFIFFDVKLFKFFLVFKFFLLIYNRVVDKMKVVYPFYESVIIKKPKKVNV